MVPYIQYEELSLKVLQMEGDVKKHNPSISPRVLSEVMFALMQLANASGGFWRRFNQIMVGYAHMSLTGSLSLYNENSSIPGSWDRSHMFLLSGPPGMGKSLFFRTLQHLSAQNPEYPHSFLYAMVEPNRGFGENNNVLVQNLKG